MPDVADVEQGLAAAIAGALYPEGAGAASAVGMACRVYRGWPVVGALEADLAAGVAHVAVRAMGEAMVTTRYPSTWQGSAPACPLLATVDGDSVLFAGAADAGVVAGVIVDGRAYAWRAELMAPPGVVAAVLAGLVRLDRPALARGAVVMFPGARGVVARAVVDGQGGREVRRQREVFRVTLWCPSVESRDRVGAFVDLSLAGTAFLDVAGWGCRVQPAGGTGEDEGGAVRAFRRDLLYHVEYPTVVVESLPSMLFGSGAVNGAGYLG